MEPEEKQKIFEKMKEIKDLVESSGAFHVEVKEIEYLDTIVLDKSEGIQSKLFLVTEKIGESQKQFYYLDDEKVAMKDEYLGIIFTEKFQNDSQAILEATEKGIEIQGSLNFSEEKDKSEEKIAEAIGEKKESIFSYTEIDAEAKITATENFYQLVPEAKEYRKVAIVRTSGESGMFHFVGITKDGEAKEFESLNPTEGVNPSQEVVSMNRDGSKIERTTVSAMYLLKGRQDEGLSIKIGQYGEIEAKYIRCDDGQDKYIASPIETRTQSPTTYEVREMMDSSKNVEVDTEIEKAQQEEKVHGNAKIQNIDDEKENDIEHDTIVRTEKGAEIDLEEIAKKERVSVQDLKEKVERQADESISMEEKIDNAIEEINEEYRHPDRSR